jgi:hypothetical protein
MTIVVDVVCAFVVLRFGSYPVLEAAGARRNSGRAAVTHYRRAGACAFAAVAFGTCAVADNLHHSDVMKASGCAAAVACVVYLLPGRERFSTR